MQVLCFYSKYVFQWSIFQEKICEDSSSFDLSPADLATAIEELNRLGEKLFEMAKNEETALVEMTDSSAMPGLNKQTIIYIRRDLAFQTYF